MKDFKDALVPLSEVGAMLPLQADQKIHRSTFHRWRSRGIAGVRLGCVRIGGLWFTSRKMVESFLTNLQKKDTNFDKLKSDFGGASSFKED